MNKETIILVSVVTVFIVGVMWYNNRVPEIVNDATRDGMPGVLDLILIKYDVDPSKLPSGSYPTGSYNAKYKILGNEDGSLAVQSIDNIYSYDYDTKGNFIKKIKNQ